MTVTVPEIICSTLSLRILVSLISTFGMDLSPVLPIFQSLTDVITNEIKYIVYCNTALVLHQIVCTGTGSAKLPASTCCIKRL